MAKTRRILSWRGCEMVAVFVSSQLLLATVVISKKHVNPANELVDLINENRTAAKLRPLNNNPGIGCMALQFVESCRGNCTTDNALRCAPPSEDDLTEIFAPNCGVELPTFGSITGRILGCHHKRLEPSEAFSQVIAADKNRLSLLKNRTYTEVGIGLVNSHKGGTIYWCILFSSDRANSTFVLEDRGVGIKQKMGCFSGSSTSCNYGQRNTNTDMRIFLMMCTLALAFLLMR